MLRTIRGLASEGRPFVGVLYAGLMLTEDGPKVLEFNARFGDPEARRSFSASRTTCCRCSPPALSGNFGVSRLHFRKEASAVIVLASEGYPERPVQGEPIEGLERRCGAPNVEIFHAGTALVEGVVVAAGGRVLSVGATGATLAEALKSAYAAAYEIHWPSKILRKDIGRRVLEQGTLSGESGIFSLPLPTDS